MGDELSRPDKQTTRSGSVDHPKRDNPVHPGEWEGMQQCAFPMLNTPVAAAIPTVTNRSTRRAAATPAWRAGDDAGKMVADVRRVDESRAADARRVRADAPGPRADRPG